MIEATTEQLDRVRRELAHLPGAVEEVLFRAINAAVAGARQEAVERVTKRYAVEPSDVERQIGIVEASPGQLHAAVIARSPALGMEAFPHSPTRAGTGGRGKPVLRAEIKRGAGKSVAGAFVAPLGGRPRIVTRTGEKTKSGRQAIRRLYSVPIARMMGVADVRQHIEARALELFDATLFAELTRELEVAT